MDPPLAVHSNFGTVPVSLQLHFVPLSVTYHLFAELHQTLATAKIKSVLQLSVHNLENTIVDQALGVDKGTCAVQSSETQAYA